MQAVLLCAGKSTRTYPLTTNKPKTLLKVLGKTILEHNLEQLDGLVDEAIIVVGYKAELIDIGNRFGKVRVSYVEQKEQTGTGSALLACKTKLKGRFLVLNGDDFYSRRDIERCLEQQGNRQNRFQSSYCVLVDEVKHPKNFGIVEVDGDRVISLEEKPSHPKSNLANTGLYVLDTGIFDLKLEKSERGEYEVTDYLKYAIDKKQVKAVKVEGYWKPTVFAWSLFYMVDLLLDMQMSEIWGEIEDSVVTKGYVIVEKGAKLGGKTVIEGNVYIGEGSVLEDVHIKGNTSIGEGCKIIGGRIERSIIGDHCKIENSVLLDSVMGDSVEISNIETCNTSRENIKVNLNGKIIDSERKRFGVLVGDGVKIRSKKLLPGEVISNS